MWESPSEKQHEWSEFQQIQKLKEENERLKNANSKEQGNAERLTQENNSLCNKIQGWQHKSIKKQFTGF